MLTLLHCSPMAQAVYLLMRTVAIRSRGGRYWLSRRQTAIALSHLTGKAPPHLNSIKRAMQQLRKRGLIRVASSPQGQVTIWELCEEGAEAGYQRIQDAWQLAVIAGDGDEGGSAADPGGDPGRCPTIPGKAHVILATK